MRRLLAVWLVGVLAALVLGACGGDDKDTENSEAASVADDGDGGSSGDQADDEAADDATGDDGAGGGGAGVGAFTAARCMEAIQAYSAGAISASQAMSGDTKAMKASIAQMEEFVEDAPREIRDELEKMSEAWEAYADGIAAAGWDASAGKPPTEQQTKQLEAAGALFEEEDYKAAQAKIDDWFASDCSAR